MAVRVSELVVIDVDVVYCWLLTFGISSMVKADESKRTMTKVRVRCCNAAGKLSRNSS